MAAKPKGYRELFVEELAEVRGGDPEIFSGDPLQRALCALHNTTMACGEETGPCAPSGC